MKIQTLRRIDRFIGVPLCALCSLLERLRSRPETAAPPRRILVILLSEMGSLVLAQPMVDQLQGRFPEAELYFLVFRKNRELLDLMERVPRERVLTLDDRSLKAFLLDSLRVLRAFRALAFDAVIDCELFARISSLFSFLSGARLRAGFHRHTQEGLYRGSFLNRPVPYNPYRHIADQFCSLAAALEATCVPRSKQAPEPQPPAVARVPFEPEQLAQERALLERRFPDANLGSLVLVGPGGGLLPIRAWPLEHYCSLCAALLQDGHAVAVIGMAEDRALAQAILTHCGSANCLDLTGYTGSLRQLLAIFHHARLLITNDGGPGHFAALTPMPSIVLFGPETPLLYRSLAGNGHALHLGLPCSPCLTAYNHRASFCDGDNQCLKRIGPEQVLALARRILLEGGQPSPNRSERPGNSMEPAV